MSQIGLGRVEVQDLRDAKYLMENYVPRTSGRTWRYWYPNGWWGDQRQTAMCVAYAWAHWAEDGPITHTRTPNGTQGYHYRGTFRGQRPAFDLDDGYNWMQRNDYWDGEEYDGTSVRAGAKYLRNQGLIENYLWAWDIDAVVRAVLEEGPVVLGTTWYMDMFTPDENGMITPTGNAAGGHAYKVDGVNRDREVARLKNSWGRGWGKNGYAYISLADLDSLIRDHGEACLPTAVAV